MTKPPLQGTCLQCKKTITILNYGTKEFASQKKFCSKNCGFKYKYRQDKESKKPNTVCSLCKKEIYKSKKAISQSKNKLFFCDRIHKNEFFSKKENKEFLPKHYFSKSKIKNLKKKKNSYRDIVFVINKMPKTCNRCGYNANKNAIVVHHIDRNRMNNDISNLEILCANCHAIEHYGDK